MSKDAAEGQVVEKPSKKRGKRPVIIGVAVVVVAAAAFGFWKWHEQPGFCDAFCHLSMNAYVETINQVDHEPGVDKYGYEVSDTHAMLVVSHANMGEKSIACLNCHEPAIQQQMGEVMETVTGNYTVVQRVDDKGYALEEVGQKALMENSLHDASDGGDAFCMKSGCHDVTREELAEKTADRAFNPHDCPHTQFACTDCHKSHRASQMACSSCHLDALENLPDGWVDGRESKQLLERIGA